MSPDSDCLFAHSYNSPLSSEFGNLTELDEDMFLSNGMETIAEHDHLAELDLKPFFDSQVSYTFGASLSGSNGDDILDSSNFFGVSLRRTDDDDVMDSTNARCSTFTMLPSEQPAFMVLQRSKTDVPHSSGVPNINMDGMQLASSIAFHEFAEGVPLSPRAMLAANNQLDCMSLDDLDFAELNSNIPLTLHGAASSLSQPGRTESTCSPTSLPPMKKSSVRSETPSLFSIHSVSTTFRQISSPLSSPSSATTFRTLAAGSLSNVLYGHDDKLCIHGMKGILAETAENRSALIEPLCPSNNPSHSMDALASSRGASVDAPHMMLGEASHNPSMQRSQSSHALGQLRQPGCLGSRKDVFGTSARWKPETVNCSAPNATNVYKFSPYEASDSTGITGSSMITPMRRVFSTGDLQNFYRGRTEQTMGEEGPGVKIGNCTAEERKTKLHRYRQKRTERNFSKKVKYVCRKTLADSRPRVRGRFARSDEFGESTAKSSDLPLIDEYEEVSSRQPWILPEMAYAVPNNSCIMHNNRIPQFWNVVGMRVAM